MRRAGGVDGSLRTARCAPERPASPRGARACRRALTAATLLILTALASLLAPSLSPAQEETRRRGFSVRITQPVTQDFVIGKSRISAEVAIDRIEAIEKVEFLVGNKLIFIDTEAPWECLHDFGPEAKETIVRAIAYHKEGITVSDFVVTRKLDLSFSVRVNRVILNASVYDKEGYFVTGLGRGDFEVLEDGVKAQIIDFNPETRPILMGILLDVSGSMQEEMEEVHGAASSLVDTLRDMDRAMLVEFSEKVYMLSDLSRDRERLKALIRSTKALGGTAMHDAVHATLSRLKPIDARKALVILSDGDDTQSTIDYKTVLEEVKVGDATLYTIALGGALLGSDARQRLKELADQSGGRYFAAGKAEDLNEVYAKIADELRNQYYITYASENERFDGRWIPIRIDTPRKGLTVRARAGYFAVSRGAE